MKLLEDHSLDIPAALQRVESGDFRYPGLLQSRGPALSERPVHHAPDVRPPGAEYGLTSHDKNVIAELRAAEKTRVVTVSREASRRAREKKREETERLHANAMRQRKVFHAHFKWGYC